MMWRNWGNAMVAIFGDDIHDSSHNVPKSMQMSKNTTLNTKLQAMIYYSNFNNYGAWYGAAVVAGFSTCGVARKSNWRCASLYQTGSV